MTFEEPPPNCAIFLFSLAFGSKQIKRPTSLNKTFHDLAPILKFISFHLLFPSSHTHYFQFPGFTMSLVLAWAGLTECISFLSPQLFIWLNLYFSDFSLIFAFTEKSFYITQSKLGLPYDSLPLGFSLFFLPLTEFAITRLFVCLPALSNWIPRAPRSCPSIISNNQLRVWSPVNTYTISVEWIN